MNWTIRKEDLSGLDVETLRPEPSFLPDQEVFTKKFTGNSCELAKRKIVSVTGDSVTNKIEYLLDNGATVNDDDLVQGAQSIDGLFEGSE